MFRFYSFAVDFFDSTLFLFPFKGHIALCVLNAKNVFNNSFHGPQYFKSKHLFIPVIDKERNFCIAVKWNKILIIQAKEKPRQRNVILWCTARWFGERIVHFLTFVETNMSISWTCTFSKVSNYQSLCLFDSFSNG